MHAVIAQGGIPSHQVVNINHFHCIHDHFHEALLHNRAKQIGVKPEADLASCSGCSQVKRGRKPIKPYTTPREVKTGGRVFLDLAGGEPVQSPGENKYMRMIVGNDYLRFTWVYFLRGKDDFAGFFMKYLVHIAPRKVETVRSDGGGV